MYTRNLLFFFFFFTRDRNSYCSNSLFISVIISNYSSNTLSWAQKTTTTNKQQNKHRRVPGFELGIYMHHLHDLATQVNAHNCIYIIIPKYLCLKRWLKLLRRSLTRWALLLSVSETGHLGAVCNSLLDVWKAVYIKRLEADGLVWFALVLSCAPLRLGSTCVNPCLFK